MIGMSGGVDSSIAAALLKEKGHEVLGVSLTLFEGGGGASTTSCCSLRAVREAAGTASSLGVEHMVIDARDLFIEKVITPFAEAYAQGITPNPCVLCNRYVKFPALLKKARELGGGLISTISTGHYARVERDSGNGRPVLKKGLDPKKDQSYFLYALRGEELEALVLPLGHWDKTDVRDRARELGLQVFDRPESQEICFVGKEGYTSMVSAIEPDAERAGPIIDAGGREIGTHKGIIHYTMGQRKGLGISSPEPLYVIRVDADENTVMVGPREQCYQDKIRVSGINWLKQLTVPFKAEVKIRSTTPGIPATVTPEGLTNATVEFERPAFAPAPGQSAVFYIGDAVIGGGEIAV